MIYRLRVCEKRTLVHTSSKTIEFSLGGEDSPILFMAYALHAVSIIINLIDFAEISWLRHFLVHIRDWDHCECYLRLRAKSNEFVLPKVNQSLVPLIPPLISTIQSFSKAFNTGEELGSDPLLTPWEDFSSSPPLLITCICVLQICMSHCIACIYRELREDRIVCRATSQDLCYQLIAKGSKSHRRYERRAKILSEYFHIHF